MNNVVSIENLSHFFPASKKGRVKFIALKNISLTIKPGEIFGLLGPNGGGKTTLFRILSTLMAPSEGHAVVLGFNTVSESRQIRDRIGVIFQSPSLDKNLTVKENLLCHARLCGLNGPSLYQHITELLTGFSLQDRADDIVDHLSGGLKRRVEILKGILHKPDLLIMDEPSTGLDPKVRRDLWDTLLNLKKSGMAILLTTHLMEEAEQCDRLGIINKGQMIAVGTPDELKRKIGGDVISIRGPHIESLLKKIEDQFAVKGQVVDDTIRIERENGHTFIPQLAEAFPGSIESISVGKPTLEDVFIHMTGEDFWKGS